MKLWDATTLLHVRTYTGHTDAAYGVSFSPTGKWILSGGFSGTLKMWETTSGRLVASMKGYNNVAFDPRGGWIASSGGKDGTVWMWRKINSRLDGWRKKVLVGHAGHVNDISFSPDGKRLASVSEDRSAIVWDTQTGKTLMTLRGHTDVVRGVSYSPDGRFLATASFDKTAKIWDTSTGSEVTTLRGHSDKLWDVVFSPKGLRLATSCWDGTVKVWDLSTGGKPKK